MKYSPAQIRALVDLPEQTFRNWRKILPPLQSRNGYHPCFSVGDALALKVIKYLTQSFGITLSNLVPLADDLFKLCQTANWDKLEQSCLLINIDGEMLHATLLAESPIIDIPTLVLPLQGMIHELRNVLLADKPHEQQTLQFPPLILKRKDVA